MTDIFAEIAGLFLGDELAADPVKWERYRCHAAPGRVSPMASVRARWASPPRPGR